MNQKKIKACDGRANPLDMAYVGMFVALTAVCAWLVVPGTVPFTMQTFAVFLAAFLLGVKRSVIAVVTYVLLGMVGAPVFAGGGGGLSVIVGPTGGFIVGFVPAVLIVGWGVAVFGRKIHVMAVVAACGQIACYVFGTVWYMTVYAQGAGEILGVGEILDAGASFVAGTATDAGYAMESAMTAILLCVVPYVISDAVKIALAIVMSRKLFRFVR